MRRIMLALIGVGLAVPFAIAATAPSASQRLFFAGSIGIVAHRGGAALFPENTIVAFRSVALRWPDAVIETDVRLTSDGVPVLIHDPTVERTTEGTGTVAAQPLAALQKLDAAYRFTTDGGSTFPNRGQGIRIPTLKEALAALPSTRFQIEIKEGVEAVAPIVQTIQAAQASSRVLVTARNSEVLQRVRAQLPQVPTNFDEAAARELVTLIRNDADATRLPAGDLVTGEPRELTAAGLGVTEITALGRGGIRVQAFTVDDPTEMRRLLDQGVASLVTNRPDLVAAALGAKAANPAATGSGASATAAGPAAPPPIRTLVSLGDSIGDPPAGTTTYIAELTKRLAGGQPGSLRVVRGARAGARSRDLAAQARMLPTDLPGPVGIVITIGGNDLREAAGVAIGGADLEVRQELRRNIADAIDDLVRPGRFGSGTEAHVYLATIYDSSDGRGGFRERGCPIAIGTIATDGIFERWNADLADLARARGAKIVDIHGVFRGHGIGSPESWYLGDCIHPNNAGHVALASAFADAIRGVTPTAPTTTATPGSQPAAVVASNATSAPPAASATAAPGARPAPGAPPPPSPAPVAPNAPVASAPAAPSPTDTTAATVHDGYFEVRLKSGAAFKVRRYVDQGASIELKRAGVTVTFKKSEIVSIQPVD